MKNLIYILSFVLLSCNNFLDEKPDISLKEPQTLDDLQALLNHENNLNAYLPSIGDIASDYYYLSEQNFNSRIENVRLLHTWDKSALTDNTWTFSMSQIFYFNLVLDKVDAVALGSMTENDRKRLKGSASFLRAMTYFQLAIIFAPQYQTGKNGEVIAIPIKRTPDIGEEIKYATLEELYNFIEQDLKTALNMLPEWAEYKTRPTRLAALTLLSRFYLSLGEWEKSLSYSEGALKSAVLIDFNTLSTDLQIPFERFNDETIFYSTVSGNESVFAPSVANVPDELIDMYEDSDLRKTLFFTGFGDKVTFKGSYTGANNSTLFGGLTSGELFLNHAETLIRSGRIDEGLGFLDRLSIMRYEKGTYGSLSGLNAQEALELVKNERRKELCFKGGIRWMDLKRYASESEQPLILKRQIGDKAYQLDLQKDPVPFNLPKTVGVEVVQ